MKKNTEYLPILKQDLKDLDALKKNLEHSYHLCVKIGVKNKYADEELDLFENLATRFSRTLSFLINRLFKNLDIVELEDEGLLLEVLEKSRKRGIVETIDELKEMKILSDDLLQEYITKNLETLYKEVFIYTSNLLDIIETTKNYCKVKQY